MGKSFIPPTLLERFYTFAYKAFILSQEMMTIPLPILKVCGHFIILMAGICFLPFDDPKFTLHILTYIVNFISGRHMMDSSNITFSIYLILFVLIAGLVLGLSFYINDPKIRKPWIYNLYVVLVVILMPLFIFLIATEFGMKLLMLIDHEFSYVLVIQAVFLFACFLLLTFFMQLVTTNSSVFISGISVFFTPKIGTLYYSSLVFLRILAVLRNAESKHIYWGISVLSIAYILFFCLYSIISNIFIIPDETCQKTSLLFASWCLIVATTSKPLDDAMMITIFLLGFVIGNFITQFLMKVNLKFSMKRIDEIVDNYDHIEEVYPLLNPIFYADLRNAMYFGREIVLRADFYEYLLGIYKPDHDFIIHSQKILLIYKSQQHSLESLNSLLNLPNMGTTVSIFNKGIRKCISLRRNVESKKCKRILNSLSTKVNNHKKHLIAYWKSISENSLNEAIHLSTICKEEEDEIRGVFENLIINYGNCKVVYKKYIKYLKYVACDNTTLMRYQAKLDFLEKTDGNTPDMIENWAKDMFIFLPSELNFNDFSKNEMINIKRDKSLASSKSMSMSDSSLSIQEEELEEFESSDQIRESANKLKINKYWWLVAFLLLSIFSTVTIGITGTLISSNTNMHIYTGLLNFTDTFTQLLISIPEASYLILSDGLVNNNVMNSKSDDYKLAFDDETWKVSKNYEKIIPQAHTISEEIDKYTMSFTNNAKVGGQIVKIMRASKFNMTLFTKNGNDLVTFNKETDYSPAINQLSNDFLSYSIDDFNQNVDFSNDPWFRSIVTNTRKVISPILNFLENLVSDINIHNSNMYSTSTILAACASVIQVLMLCVIIYLLVSLKNLHLSIIRTVSHLPPLAFVLITKKLTARSKDNDDENGCASNSGVLSGLATRTTPGYVVLIIINVVLSVVLIIAIWVFRMFMMKEDRAISAFPEQRMYFSVLGSASFNAISILKEAVAANSGKDVTVDDIDINDVFDLTIKSMVDCENDLIFGSGNTKNGIVNFNSEPRKIFFDGEYGEQENLFERLVNEPTIAALQVFISNMNDLSRDIDDPNIITKNNKKIIESEIYASDYLSDVVTRGAAATLSIVDVIDELFILGIVTVFAIYGVCLIVVIFEIYKLNKIMESIRFTISSLAMLQQDIVHSNDGITNLLSGNFNSDCKHETIGSHFVEAVENNTDALIFIIDQTADILFMNPAATNFFSNKPVSFNEFVEIDDKIRAVITSKTRKELSFDKDIKEILKDDQGNDTESTYKMHIKLFKQGNTHITIAIALRDREQEIYNEKIENSGKIINDINTKIVPHDMRENFEDGKIILDITKSVVFSCKFANLNLNEDFSEALKIIDDFYKTNYAVKKMMKDCKIIKKSGNILFYVINMDKKYENNSELMKELLNFVKELSERNKEKGIMISAAATFADNMKVGRISSNSTNFNMWGTSIFTNYKFIRHAEEGHFKFDKDLFRYMPSSKLSSSVIDDKIDDCYDIEFLNM